MATSKQEPLSCNCFKVMYEKDFRGCYKRTTFNIEKIGAHEFGNLKYKDENNENQEILGHRTDGIIYICCCQIIPSTWKYIDFDPDYSLDTVNKYWDNLVSVLNDVNQGQHLRFITWPYRTKEVCKIAVIHSNGHDIGSVPYEYREEIILEVLPDICNGMWMTMTPMEYITPAIKIKMKEICPNVLKRMEEKEEKRKEEKKKEEKEEKEKKEEEEKEEEKKEEKKKEERKEEKKEEKK